MLGSLADALAIPDYAAGDADTADRQQGLRRWDLQNRVGIKMPFPDGDFLVWLDALLPEVRCPESKEAFDRI